MPRKKVSAGSMPRSRVGDELAERLAEELRASRESGQPLIEEEEYPTGKRRVVVIWDEWDRLAFDDRTAAILQAYASVEGKHAADNILLASGLTVPEGHASGMLPFQIIAAVRASDPVTYDQCRQAMLEEGASTLASPDPPQLRFPTLDDAEAARQRLSQRLPGSEPVWVINQDVGRVEEWMTR